MFHDVYKNKKVLVTGHTGFKGSWLTAWLLKLGAEVVGVSKDIPTLPSNYKVLELDKKIKNHICDIRDFNCIYTVIKDEMPDFIFHLAAQAIVSVSYDQPIETLTTNILGTTNVLESIRLLNSNCIVVIITSDKAYDNVEQVWGYKENDPLGGKDIYSGSKGAADLVIKSYYHSFFDSVDSKVRMAVGRAGNVIGGGDWAKDRIVVDCMKAWSENEKVEIRCPAATRPWQHVLEPLSGYLCLGQALFQSKKVNGEAFNFGPKADQNHTVEKLIGDLSLYWNYDSPSSSYSIVDNLPFHEAGLLKLNCDKSLSSLCWQANWNYHETVKFTSEWYYKFYSKVENMYELTMDQISTYEKDGFKKDFQWTV